MTGHAWRIVQVLLATAAATVLLTANAAATHSTKDHLTIGPSGGNANADVFFDFSSADGAKAFFETPESLVAADTDTAYDMYQRQGGTTTLISTGPAGGNGPHDVFPSASSDDGTRAFFETEESLVSGDTDGLFDIYERAGGTTSLVSTGPAGGNGAFDAFFLASSADGARAIFETDESLVAGDTDIESDIYQHSGGTTTLLSTGPTGGNGSHFAVLGGISDDATHVFIETEERLTAADTDNSFDVYDRSGGATTLVSTGPAGGNGVPDATFRGSSLDGTSVFFQTSEALVAADTDTSTDVYQRTGATTTLVSTGTTGGNGTFAATFDAASGDGARVLFHTKEALVAADTDASTDVYERAGATTTLISTGPAGGNGAFDVSFSGSSVNGARVFFETRESLVAGDTDGNFDVYERAGGATSHLSTGPAGGNGALDANFVGASLDGGRVFFETVEKLVTGDTDAFNDLYERFAGATTHISFGPTGGNGTIGAFFAGASDDGARVFFDTREALMSSDTDIARDVYAADVAGFARPRGSTPLRVSLVPAYRACAAANRTHGPPLASPSCNPPLLESTQLTVGTPDANGAGANAVGAARYDVVVGAPGGANDSDVRFTFSFTDVRVQGSLADYTGQLQATTTVRITDKDNGPSGTESATVGDVALPVTVGCAATGSTTVGSTCSLTTTFQAISPGLVPEGDRAIWQFDRVHVNDGGADGVVSTTPNTLFATQGIFVP